MTGKGAVWWGGVAPGPPPPPPAAKTIRCGSCGSSMLTDATFADGALLSLPPEDSKSTRQPWCFV